VESITRDWIGGVDGNLALLTGTGGASPVGHDAKQPGLETGATLEAFGALQDSDPGVLGKVLGGGDGIDVVARDLNQDRVVTLHQRTKGVSVAHQKALEQFLVVHTRERSRCRFLL